LSNGIIESEKIIPKPRIPVYTITINIYFAFSYCNTTMYEYNINSYLLNDNDNVAFL